jgi:hypothetical protein
MVSAEEAEAGSAGEQPARNILLETHSDECRGAGLAFFPVFLSLSG